jgi:hypothetical protein
MNRRYFIQAAISLAGALAARRLFGGSPAAAFPSAPARADWWQPLGLPQGVALEWRYLAGRITRPEADFGFVCSLVDYKLTEDGQPRKELIVMRQELPSGAHTTHTYRGTLGYDAASLTYSFETNEQGASASATWQLDAENQVYRLSVATPELALASIELRPEGGFLPEGGDGAISIGALGGAQVDSDYYADWLGVFESGVAVGAARLDMQTVKPRGLPSGELLLAHSWFCVAAEQGGQPLWLTAWRIETDTTLHWNITVARGGTDWSVTATDETSAAAHPLAVEILEWQAIPNTSPPQRTGSRWRITAGQRTPGDLLDIEVAVPPGQFIRGARVISLAPEVLMQEALSLSASGSLGGQPLVEARFVVGESTYSERLPQIYVPIVRT